VVRPVVGADVAFAMFKPEAVAVHLEDVNVVGEAIEQRHALLRMVRNRELARRNYHLAGGVQRLRVVDGDDVLGWSASGSGIDRGC
jgi:hypothetical protein